MTHPRPAVSSFCPHPFCRPALVLGLLVALTPATASAATRYWDIDGPTAGPGGSAPSGVWDTGTTANWNQNTNGNSGFNTFGSGDDAIFSAGTTATGAFTVTLSGTNNVSSLVIEEGSPTFTGGTVNFSDATPTFTIASGATLNWGSTLLTSTGTGTAINLGATGGTLNFTQDRTFTGTLNVSGGTIRLTDTDLTIGTLNITGNTVIDFAGTASSINLTNFSVAVGSTLTLLNWTRSIDYFYTQNWTGATLDTNNAAPMNRVIFDTFTASQTAWFSFDKQVAPIPEPASTGLLTLAVLLAAPAFRRPVRPSARPKRTQA